MVERSKYFRKFDLSEIVRHRSLKFYIKFQTVNAATDQFFKISKFKSMQEQKIFLNFDFCYVVDIKDGIIESLKSGLAGTFKMIMLAKDGFENILNFK